jgi:O-antigen ligase
MTIEKKITTRPRIAGDLAMATGLGLAVAAVCVVLAGLLAPAVGLQRYDFAVILAVVLGVAGVAVLVLGPSWIIISLFVAKMFLGHQHLSLFVLPLGGIEFTPRELWLFLLIGHFAAQLVLGRLTIRPDLFHYFVYLYAFYFMLIAAVGVWNQPNLTAIIQELRYPIFLGTYFIFATCAPTRENLWWYAKGILALTVCVATASTLFFFYTFLTGNVINVQNSFGEFVRRAVGPLLLQSVRPNGHMYFEVCSVVLIALLCCPTVKLRWKLVFTALLGLFAFAIVITMMRTAYVALACSLAALAFLGMPRGVRWVAALCGVTVVCFGAAIFGFEIYEQIRRGIPDLEVSLQARMEEMRGAWKLFTYYPLFGAGMGSSFEGMGWAAKSSSLAYARGTYQTLHNVWMYFLLKGGLVGITLILFALGGILGRAYHLMEHREDAFERFFMRGLLAAVAGQLVASLAMPRLTFPEGHVFLAMATAAFFILSRPRETHAGETIAP